MKQFRIQKQLRWVPTENGSELTNQYWIEKFTPLFYFIPWWTPILSERAVRQEGPGTIRYFNSAEGAETFLLDSFNPGRPETESGYEYVISTVKEFHS